jgi:FKBP-type peptidyl-prolyl cis-trans isomerase SlyD
MKIAKNTVVTFDYKLTNDAGEVLDTSEGAAPLDYLHGAENIVPGLEKALEGKSVGDQLNVSVSPEEGYGPRDEELIQAVPREMFQGVDELEVGMQFQAESEHGVHVVRIASVNGDEVTVDANHPLAGETLHFDVTVRGVREASGEELEHGHVHAEGHCH